LATSQVVHFLIDNEQPEVEITRPAAGQLCTRDVCVDDPLGETRVIGPVILAATASDPGSAPSGVAKVEFQIDGGAWREAFDIDGDGEWTYTWDTTLEPTGTHVVRARATDDVGMVSVIKNRPVTVVA
jgi:hypothetical protein